ncbi:MAG: PKD domain-containing protein [Parvularculaceae bacterium]
MTRFSFETSRRIGINAAYMKIFVAFGALLLAAACTAASSVNDNSASSSPASSGGSTSSPSPAPAPAPAPTPNGPAHPAQPTAAPLSIPAPGTPIGCSASCLDVCVDDAVNEGVCLTSPATATAVIDASQTDCIAPCGVHFAAIAGGFATARPFHKLTYQWRFGDPSATFSALAADFPFARSADRAQGPYAAHVFENPGTYSVSLDVTDSTGVWARTSATITVRDPATMFSGGSTVCYSKAGNFSGCPAGATTYTSIESAVVFVRQNPPAQLLIRAGETTQLASGSAVTLNGSGPYRITRFGAGADPILRSTDSTRIMWLRDTGDVSVSNIEFKGDYDAHTGIGETIGDAIFVSNSHDVTIFQNKFSGLGESVHIIDYQNAVIANNDISNWYNFGILTGPEATVRRLAIVGNNIRQKADALSGPGGKSQALPRWADHGPIRVAAADKLVVTQNDLRSLTGWSTNGEAHQPSIRYNTEGYVNHSGVMEENRMEGGFVVVRLGIANAGRTATLGDIMIERNLLIGTSNTRRFMESGYGSLTVRNNLFYMPPVDNQYPARTDEFGDTFDVKTPQNAAAPVEIYNNTFVSLRPDNGYEHYFIRQRSDNPYPLTDVRDWNNILEFPNVANASDYSSFAPLDANNLFRPLAGSPAIGSGTAYDGLFDTLDGFNRPASPSMGALEP